MGGFESSFREDYKLYKMAGDQIGRYFMMPAIYFHGIISCHARFKILFSWQLF